MIQLDRQLVRQFQQEILSWYAIKKRDLPWRKTRDPYRILVSEIMLQQTQVERVIPKYNTWLKTFPLLKNLANAKKEDVLLSWSGLGYNRRALYLQKCAITIDVNRFWPQSIDELEKLPGIGPYTARAVACFAFDKQVALLDTNIRKIILLRFRNTLNPDSDNPKVLQALADQLLPFGKAYDWNQALMDYSSLVLQQEKISMKKQSTFKNSNRYYRGKLLRILLEKKEITVESAGYLIRDDFSPKDIPWRDKLLQDLIKDGLITLIEDKITF